MNPSAVVTLPSFASSSSSSSFPSSSIPSGWMSSFPSAPAMSCASSYLQSFQSSNNSSQITSVGSDDIHTHNNNPFFSSFPNNYNNNNNSNNNNPFAIFASPAAASSASASSSSEERSSDMDDDNLAPSSSSSSSDLRSFTALSSALPALSAALSNNNQTTNNPFVSSSSSTNTPSSSSSSSSLYSIHVPEEVLQRRPALRLLLSASVSGKKRTIDSIVSESMRSVKSRLNHHSIAEEEEIKHSSALSAALSSTPSPPSSPTMKTDENTNNANNIIHSNNARMAVEQSSSSLSSNLSLVSSERRRLYSIRDSSSKVDVGAGSKRVKGVNGGRIVNDDDEEKNEKEPIPFPSHDYHDNADIVNACIVLLKQKKSSKQTTPITTPMKSNTVSSSTAPALYTSDQVFKIVADALKTREEQIREEYNQVLHELLREQWEQFSTFNQHYVSRQLAKSDSSYIC